MSSVSLIGIIMLIGKLIWVCFNILYIIGERRGGEVKSSLFVEVLEFVRYVFVSCDPRGRASAISFYGFEGDFGFISYKGNVGHSFMYIRCILEMRCYGDEYYIGFLYRHDS